MGFSFLPPAVSVNDVSCYTRALARLLLSEVGRRSLRFVARSLRFCCSGEEGGRLARLPECLERLPSETSCMAPGSFPERGPDCLGQPSIQACMEIIGGVEARTRTTRRASLGFRRSLLPGVRPRGSLRCSSDTPTFAPQRPIPETASKSRWLIFHARNSQSFQREQL